MNRALTTRHWARGRPNPGSCRLHALLPVQLPPSYPHVAKYVTAALSASTGFKPTQSNLSSRLTSRPVIHFTRSYRSPPNKASKLSGSEKAEGGAKAANPADTAAALDRAKEELFADGAIPSEDAVLAALDKCSNAASLRTGSSTGQATSTSVESGSAASSLLSLDESHPEPEKPAAAQASTRSSASSPSSPSRLSDLDEHILEVAFDIVTHPKVVITQDILEDYIAIQARLGRPEALPHVLDLYATKPQPVEKAGSITFKARWPNSPFAAVPAHLADKALDVAIEAKNIDVAIAIIENTYRKDAFIWAKIIRKCTLPFAGVALLPAGIWIIAGKLATWQDSYTVDTFTKMAAAGLTTYVLCTGSLGLIALATYNDQMKRVQWAPGFWLRDRWMYEESRAAYDKVALSFGFQEPDKYGEEKGHDYQALKKLVLLRGMILDKIELMKGMD